MAGLLPVRPTPQALVSSVRVDLELATNKAQSYKREMLKMEEVMEQVRCHVNGGGGRGSPRVSLGVVTEVDPPFTHPLGLQTKAKLRTAEVTGLVEQ